MEEGIICKSCQKPNRNIAKYCRFCGSLINATVVQGKSQKAERDQRLDDYVGLDSIRSQCENFINRLKIEKVQKERGLSFSKPTTVLLFKGESGTGKTTVAEYFIQQLTTAGVLENKPVKRYSGSAIVREHKDEFGISQYVTGNANSILFIDDVLKDNFSSILHGLTKKPSETICIVAGNKNFLDEYFSKDAPEDAKSVTDFYDFPDTPETDLVKILEQKLKKIGFVYNDEVKESFFDCISEAKHSPKCQYKNGWVVENEVLREIRDKQASRLQNNFASLSQDDYIKITTEDLPVVTKKLTVEEVFAELDALIGMDDVKKTLRKLYQKLLLNKERESSGLSNSKDAVHFVLTGNPGTGKTTVAKLLGKLFKAMKLLPSDKVVETDASGMIAQYTGQTAPLVNKRCDEAMGGVLFIDEAYSIVDKGGGGFGQQAIDALVKRMDADRGNFIVVAAGYKNEMEDFLKANAGLKSRFTDIIHIQDYNAEELYQIYELFAKKAQYVLSAAARDVLVPKIEDIIKEKDDTFANGRTIRNLFDETVRNLSARVAAIPSEQRTPEIMSVIEAEDIPHKEEKKVMSADEVLAELDSMIGMAEVKKTVRELCKSIQMTLERAKNGTETKMPEVHFVFTGNPGTGKTTVARLLGKLFYAIGLLPKDLVVETDRSGLVASYTGQTAPLVNQKCNEAMGGVLFIDEAYTLANDLFGGFGQEAIDTLLKRMEDDRGKFIVIAAGYKIEMERFIHSNSGLESRFTNFINLEDYNPDELVQLFQLYAKKEHLVIDGNAMPLITERIRDIWENRTETFANGRTIRNYFNKIKMKMDSRVADIPQTERTPEMLVTITQADVEASEVR